MFVGPAECLSLSCHILKCVNFIYLFIEDILMNSSNF